MTTHVNTEYVTSVMKQQQRGYSPQKEQPRLVVGAQPTKRTAKVSLILDLVLWSYGKTKEGVQPTKRTARVSKGGGAAN